MVLTRRPSLKSAPIASAAGLTDVGLAQGGSQTPATFRKPKVVIPIPTPAEQYQKIQAGVPDSKLTREATGLLREFSTPLLFNHSHRVFFWANEQGRRAGEPFDVELLFICAAFHDLGLLKKFSSETDRNRRSGFPPPYSPPQCCWSERACRHCRCRHPGHSPSVIVGTLENPKKYAGATYQLHGPVEYSHQEIAGVLSKTLNKPILFEQATVPEFLKLLGMEGDKAKQAHFEAVRIDQQEGLLAGTDSIGTEIIGQPLMTLEGFIRANKSALS